MLSRSKPSQEKEEVGSALMMCSAMWDRRSIVARGATTRRTRTHGGPSGRGGLQGRQSRCMAWSLGGHRL